MSELKYVKLEKKQGIAYVSICRPEALNALNVRVLQELGQVFDDVDMDSDVHVAILTGEGKAFVAGADIAQMKEQSTQDGRDFIVYGQKIMEKIENLNKPVIAAVNGFALGGGCELAMACDFRVASAKAKFGQPEVNLGIIPGFGGTQRLTRLVGKGTAKYLIMTAEVINAEEAYRIGLVQKVVEPENLIPECEKIASVIMGKAPIAIKMAKHAINTGSEIDIKSGVAYEAEAFTTCFGAEDRVEGMTAFLEKRKADFKNK